MIVQYNMMRYRVFNTSYIEYKTHVFRLSDLSNFYFSLLTFPTKCHIFLGMCVITVVGELTSLLLLFGLLVLYNTSVIQLKIRLQRQTRFR